ncbi:zinc finger protein 638-like [Plectropomus leopardus]|uniref:zinc finger protein 638-like n=1 Tax=Plectropomus leopardus TaxID=160734 RepID=UPI001C4BD50E|nr:zinc finger protein 638-like [Plectropomus leopardus]
MQKTSKKRRAQRTCTNLMKAAHHLAVHTDSNLHLAPSPRLEPSAFSVANSTRGTHFIFGPVVGAAAVTALRLAQIETQAQIALQQLATLATVTVGNQCHNNGFAATLSPHLALLNLLNRQQVSTVGFNVDTNSKTYRNTRLSLSAAMYHHHSQQPGPQPFSNGPRPPHHQQPQNQHQNRSPSNMLSQGMGFQFPRPTQLPDELESALAIRGGRDIDHRIIDHMNRPNQHQNQGSGPGISQHGNYGSLTSDNQAGHQQGVDWSSYQPPTKLFASPPPSAGHQPPRHQGPQQQPQSSHTGTNIPSWTTPVSDSPSPQARHPHSGGSGGSGDGQALYTPESAGSILASFGLSNEDLEVLSHYPDDQLTPDTLPFILRDIQINKSGNQKTVAPTSSSSFSRSSPLARSRTPEVPSLLTVTQTAGKVIDYGHASRAKDESKSTRETFKREPLPSERTVKMYPSSSSSSAPKIEKVERRHDRLELSDSSKLGDQDYRRSGSESHRSNRSPAREFPPASKSRNLDRDYRREGPKLRPPSETKSETSSRRSLSSSSGSKPYSSNKKLPTPTMISDFSAVSPKVYPHTCSLCHTQCDEEKDWVDHINTVNHTAACRDLRNKYPHWKPNLPSRSGRYGSRAQWDPRDHSRSHSRSISTSPPQSPSHSRHRVGPHSHRLHTGPYHPHHQHYTGGPSHSGLKRPHDDSSRFSPETSRHPSSYKTGHSFKHGPLQSSSKTVKSGMKPGTKTTKMASDTSAKPPPAKKKKKVVTPASQDWSVADRLVFLTGIPKDATEQEVTDLVGSFGKINNVILMPCSEEESEKGEGQKASVCMMSADDAQALANSTDLSIKDQQITASVAKKPEAGQSSDANNSKPAPGPEKGAAGEDSGGEADQKTSDEKGMLLITGLPESGWMESDITKLVQPFGTPSDIILAAQIGKVLVSVPDMEIAQEIVKVHTFIPAKINDSELKIVHVKQRIGLSTPVALYNLLIGSADPLESPVPVSWSSLLVISNVPNTPSASSEVQKLVRRFGTVIKTLVLNNMVICEMATAAMSLSVYKRFQMFPCIIQNNPLFFSRKADPKISTQTKVITAYLDSPEDTPASGKGSQAAAADEEETAHKENSESSSENIEKDVDGKDEKMKSTEEPVGENKEIIKDEHTDAPSDSLAAPDAKPETDMETDMQEKSAAETVKEATDENKVSTTGTDETPAAEETKPVSSEDKAASRDAAMPELPKVTQEMVNALLVECRTRTANHTNNTATSANGEQGETHVETEQGKQAAKETKEPAKNHAEEEVKKQERDRKEREARKEKEARERERKERERERRAWEKEERIRRDRERDERARRERERRERERRERKRAYREGSSGSRSSFRSEGYRQSSWRDDQYDNSEAETKKVEEEEDDEFPFDMGDFVTVDEVGDVTDLPSPPAPSVPMETTEEGEEVSSSVQQDTPEDTPMEDTTETLSDATATMVKSDEHVSESEPVTMPTVDTSDDIESSDSILGPFIVSVESLSQPDASHSQTHEPACEPQASETEITPETDTVSPETEVTPTATVDSTAEVETPPMPAPEASAAPAESSSDCTATAAAASESEKYEKEDSAVSHSQANKEETVSEKTEKQEKIQVDKDKETAAPAVETGKPEKSDAQTKTKEESASKENSLPPFDPSRPVGMEYLVPKTGFFCKVCNRFFSGNKEAEIIHCKTLKHYESLQKYLQTMKTANVTAKPV